MKPIDWKNEDYSNWSAVILTNPMGITVDVEEMSDSKGTVWEWIIWTDGEQACDVLTQGESRVSLAHAQEQVAMKIESMLTDLQAKIAEWVGPPSAVRISQPLSKVI